VRRLLLGTLLVALGSFGPLAPACGAAGTGAAPPADSSPPREDARPASEAAASPISEAGTDDDVFVGSGCITDVQCARDGGTLERCGYAFDQGCSASGTCVIAAVPVTEAGTASLACGCDGEPVPYVTETMTSAPVASPGPCAPDGGSRGDASDAATGESDASLE